MKRKKTIRVNKNKLNSKYKFLSKGGEFKNKSVCQLQENLGDGTGWFLGIRNTGNRNKIKCHFEEFDIIDPDGKIVELQNEF